MNSISQLLTYPYFLLENTLSEKVQSNLYITALYIAVGAGHNAFEQ